MLSVYRPLLFRGSIYAWFPAQVASCSHLRPISSSGMTPVFYQGENKNRAPAKEGSRIPRFPCSRMARTGPTKSSWTAIAPSESRPARSRSVFSGPQKLHQTIPAGRSGDLPAETVIDGEVVALDDSGHPDFHRRQHFPAEASRIRFYGFDLLILNGYDLTNLPLSERRRLLAGLKLRASWIRISEQFDTSGDDMIAAVRQEQLEGVVAKRKDSLCEAGKRTGSWAKLRINRRQEFVGGGFTPGPHGLDAIIVGYFREKDLVYVARVRNGFVPRTRRMLPENLKTACHRRMYVRESTGDRACERRDSRR
jgi:hypothetical protein